jgi:peptidoglycan hydrolase CwlO-like protein
MKRSTTTPFKRVVASATLVAAALLVVFSTPLSVSADIYEQRIRVLEQEIEKHNAQAAELRSQGDSLQNVLNSINSQKLAIQSRIEANQARYDQLKVQIADTEQKIEDRTDFLGKNLAALYVESSITPLEMFASSDSIGDFIDKQEYRSVIRDKVSTSIDEVKQLKSELEEKRVGLKRVLDDQKRQRATLVAKETEQANLVAQTRGEESRYREVSAELRAERERVEAEKQAAYAAARQSWGGGYVSVGGGGSYPWAGVPYPCWSAGCADPWGLYYRECVSYVAWKLDSEGYGVQHFNGAGNANQWPSATSSYTSQSSTPKVGDAAVDVYLGAYGHVGYVEQVFGDGTMRISEYNFAGPGQYSVRDISPGQYSGWVFLTFPER